MHIFETGDGRTLGSETTTLCSLLGGFDAEDTTTPKHCRVGAACASAPPQASLGPESAEQFYSSLSDHEASTSGPWHERFSALWRPSRSAMATLIRGTGRPVASPDFGLHRGPLDSGFETFSIINMRERRPHVICGHNQQQCHVAGEIIITIQQRVTPWIGPAEFQRAGFHGGSAQKLHDHPGIQVIHPSHPREYCRSRIPSAREHRGLRTTHFSPTRPSNP